MRLATLGLLLILLATQITNAQPPKKASSAPKAQTQVKEEIPLALLAVQDPITRGVQYDKFPATEEKKVLDGLRTILDDVKKAAEARALELPVNPDNLLRGPVEKKLTTNDVRQRLVICEQAHVKHAENAIILAYSDVTIDVAKNCVIIAGRMVDVNEVENCVIISGAVKSKLVRGGQPTPQRPAAEGKPSQVIPPSLLLARSWISATSVSDSLVWTIQTKPRDDTAAASLVIDKATRVSLLTPVLGREIGTLTTCKTYSPPIWAKK